MDAFVKRSRPRDPSSQVVVSKSRDASSGELPPPKRLKRDEISDSDSEDINELSIDDHTMKKLPCEVDDEEQQHGNIGVTDFENALPPNLSIVSCIQSCRYHG